LSGIDEKLSALCQLEKDLGALEIFSRLIRVISTPMILKKSDLIESIVVRVEFHGVVGLGVDLECFKEQQKS
jgi:hypothetical protein